MPVLSMQVKVSKTNYVQGANIVGFVKVADAHWRRGFVGNT